MSKIDFFSVSSQSQYVYVGERTKCLLYAIVEPGSGEFEYLPNVFQEPEEKEVLHKHGYALSGEGIGVLLFGRQAWDIQKRVQEEGQGDEKALSWCSIVLLWVSNQMHFKPLPPPKMTGKNTKQLAARKTYIHLTSIAQSLTQY